MEDRPQLLIQATRSLRKDALRQTQSLHPTNFTLRPDCPNLDRLSKFIDPLIKPESQNIRSSETSTVSVKNCQKVRTAVTRRQSACVTCSCHDSFNTISAGCVLAECRAFSFCWSR